MTDIQVFPFFSTVSLEVFPCVTAMAALYTSGNVQGMAYEALEIEDARLTSELRIGATYIAVGQDEDGKQVQTHWMYCTQVAPHPTFGISRNHRIPGVYGPAPFLCSSLFVELEHLTNIVGRAAEPAANIDVAEFRLGEEGMLIATAFGTPHVMGIQVQLPFLPPHFLTGARNLVITAQSVRTGQTVVLPKLTCLRASSPAVFLQEDPL